MNFPRCHSTPTQKYNTIFVVLGYSSFYSRVVLVYFRVVINPRILDIWLYPSYCNTVVCVANQETEETFEFGCCVQG